MFGAGDGVEEVVVERGGGAEAGHEIVHELPATDGAIVLTVATRTEAFVGAPRPEGFGLVLAETRIAIDPRDRPVHGWCDLEG